MLQPARPLAASVWRRRTSAEQPLSVAELPEAAAAAAAAADAAAMHSGGGQTTMRSVASCVTLPRVTLAVAPGSQGGAVMLVGTVMPLVAQGR